VFNYISYYEYERVVDKTEPTRILRAGALLTHAIPRWPAAVPDRELVVQQSSID
jgi:hypothetical protein